MGVHGNATHGRIANPPEHQGQLLSAATHPRTFGMRWAGWDAAGSNWGLSWAEELPRFRHLHYCAHSSHTHGFDAVAPMTLARMQG
jgi:hypothetical protein